MEVNLEGPKKGEVLVEIKATGICHTDEFTLSGADPEGIFPAILGHEGAGVVVEVGEGVTSLKKGDHVIPLYTPECRQCPSCLSRKTNLCTAIRATQGKGLMPDGTSRFSTGWHADLSLHGLLDLLEPHRAAGNRAGQGRPRGRALRQDLLHRLRRDHRHRRGDQHRQGGIGANRVVFGLGGIGLNVIQGLKMAGADMIIGVDSTTTRRNGASASA
jgi:S-(hydroxymethyl)glutathione dehydrogenase/alcohol dehydrogenase